MSAYQTLVVGTDGSDTSLRAVDHAAALAAQNHATLIIAMAHLPNVDKGGWGRPARPDRVIDGRAEVVLAGEGDSGWVNSGLVVAGNVARCKTFGLSAIGGAVNVVARVELAARQTGGLVVLTGQTLAFAWRRSR